MLYYKHIRLKFYFVNPVDYSTGFLLMQLFCQNSIIDDTICSHVVNFYIQYGIL